jgi:hypothetical protein
VLAEPQRVPAFPRPLETARPADGARPVDTIPGTQVYRAPEAPARATPDPLAPAEAARAPGPNARVVTIPSAAPSATGSAASAPSGGPTSAMGANPREALTVSPVRPGPVTGSGAARSPAAGNAPTGDGDSGSAPATPVAPAGTATGSAGSDASQ